MTGEDNLKLVSSTPAVDERKPSEAVATPAGRDLDWSILMARTQNGDAEAYGRLLGEITPYLRSHVSYWHRDRRDVEDSVQDVLLTIHAVRQTYDPARPFGPWLIGIANRRVFDRLRRQHRLRAREAVLAPVHEEVAAINDSAEAMADRRRLRLAIETLPPTQRQAIELLKLKELSLKEAASVSGLSIVSLKVATHRALKSLRAMLVDRNEA